MKWAPDDEFDDFSSVSLNSSPNWISEDESSSDEQSGDIELVLKQISNAALETLETSESENESDSEEQNIVTTVLNSVSLQSGNVSNFRAANREQTATETCNGLKMPVLIGGKFFQFNETKEKVVKESPKDACIESQFETLFGASSSSSNASMHVNREEHERHLAANAARYRNLNVDKSKPESKLRKGIDIGRNTNYVLRPRLD